MIESGIELLSQAVTNKMNSNSQFRIVLFVFSNFATRAMITGNRKYDKPSIYFDVAVARRHNLLRNTRLNYNVKHLWLDSCIEKFIPVCFLPWKI